MTKFLLAFILLPALAWASDLHTVCRQDGATFAVLRTYGATALLVNLSTLETKIAPRAKLSCSTEPITETTYARLLERFDTQTLDVNANEGFKQFNARCGLSLTMDLCPASEPNEQHPHRPLDIEYFDALAKYAREQKTSVKVTLFVSGHWIDRHPEQVARLKKGWPGVELTFGNHSDTHPYLKGETYRLNFMTQMSAGEFRAEILATEAKMIKAGLTPSVFFRFPGLMSNKGELAELKSLGLIAVGTSAWTAVNGWPDQDYKGFDFSADQAPRAGRIVLTHGNGNEDAGVRGKNGFLTYLAQNKTTFTSLTEALACAD